MGTSSIIGRPTPTGWEGRLCSYDGHPDHQGRVLFEAVTGHFAGDVDAARGYFIDDHPAGWSYLGGDFTKPTGHLPPGHLATHSEPDERNQCLCHGDRHDPPAPLITHRDQLPWTDYGYLLGDDNLTMLVPSHGSLWAVAEVDWAAAPDWDDLSARLRHGTSHLLRLP